MTDKQIIIDGVDVSGCEFFDSGNCVECDMRVHFYGDVPCDDECNRNCYYKQLKRKEQECEKLKKENYELTEEVNIDRALFAEIDKLKAERDSYIDKYFIESQKVVKLNKTLKEIKEILIFNKKELEECLHNDIDGQILQKINEVEDE